MNAPATFIGVQPNDGQIHSRLAAVRDTAAARLACSPDDIWVKCTLVNNRLEWALTRFTGLNHCQAGGFQPSPERALISLMEKVEALEAATP